MCKVDLFDRLPAPDLSAAEVDQSPCTVLDQHAARQHGSTPLLMTPVLLSATDGEQDGDVELQDLLCMTTCTTQRSVLSLNLYCVLKLLILAL